MKIKLKKTTNPFNEITCIPKYKLDDNVRLLKIKNVFDKGYTTKWTDELFTIVEMCHTNSITYKFTNSNNKEITGIFYE